MSDQIDWSALGKQTQESAVAEAQRKALEAEDKQRELLRQKVRADAVKAATHVAMANIQARCQQIVTDFNSGIKQSDLKMTVSDESREGAGLLSFTVRKESGFPRVSLTISDKRMILVTLQKNRVPGGGANHYFAVREDGQVTGPNGTPNFTDHQVAELACKTLLDADYWA